jgi:aminoglycoside phosphotransferase (APT) family kinase protein
MAEALAVKARLGDFLGAAPDPFQVLASGWETTVFEFALRSVPDRIAVPAGRMLVLRFYDGPAAIAKGSHEYAVMQRLQAARFPVPAVYMFQPDPAVLGAPFLIMERLEGGPLLRLRSFPSAVKTFTLAFLPFVRLHTRLHRLNPATVGISGAAPGLSPGAEGGGPSILGRVLATIAERVESGPLPWLGPALQWAVAESARFRDGAASVLHLDYHPFNVLVKGGHVTGIIDWVKTEPGDRHLDVATTSTILSCHTMDNPQWLRDNLSGNSLRRLYNALYVALYHAMMPLEFPRLRYYQGVAALFRLSTVAMMRRRGAESVGYRAEASREVTPAVIEVLARYAARKCRVPIAPPPM